MDMAGTQGFHLGQKRQVRNGMEKNNLDVTYHDLTDIKYTGQAMQCMLGVNKQESGCQVLPSSAQWKALETRTAQMP